MQDAENPWPKELRLHKDRAAITIVFDNGEVFSLSAEYLRVKSPSAEVQGHSPQERKTVPGKKDVAIIELHPVGNYAVRLVCDDFAEALHAGAHPGEIGALRGTIFQFREHHRREPAKTQIRFQLLLNARVFAAEIARENVRVGKVDHDSGKESGSIGGKSGHDP